MVDLTAVPEPVTTVDWDDVTEATTGLLDIVDAVVTQFVSDTTGGFIS